VLTSTQVLSALADNAKTNQHGRVDEHGTLCYRHVELCPVGALAILFYFQFHVLSLPAPDFSADFNKPDYGEFGYCSWYDRYIFWSGDNPSRQMTYESEVPLPFLLFLF